MKALSIIGFVFASISFTVLVVKAIKAGIYHSNNILFDKIIYFFTRSNQSYRVEKQKSTYIYKDSENIEVNVNMQCISNADGLTSCDRSFAWNGDRNCSPVVEYKQANGSKKELKNLNRTTDHTTFTYPLDTISKKDDFAIDYTIKNLTDSTHCATYISGFIKYKTQTLTLRVIPPQGVKLKNVTYKVERNHTPVKFWSKHAKVECLKLEYDNSIDGYQYVIKYPRIGYNYIVDWDL